MLLVERKDDLLDRALPSVHQVVYSLTDLAYIQAPRRGWGWGGFSPPTFLAD